MEQYIEFIRQTIIKTILNTKDEKTLHLIYGMLMNSNIPINQEECSSIS